MKHFLLCTLPLAGLVAAPALGQAIAFSTAVAYNSGGNSTSGVAAQDLNGDGRLDIVVSNGFGTVGVLLNTGTGTFPATAVSYPSGATAGNTSAVALGDVNGDGKTDVVVLNTNDSTVGLLLGTGTGTFGAVTTYPTASFSYPGGLALADVNSDGRADVLVANGSTSTVGVLLGRSTGGLATAVQYAIGSPQSLAAGDMNGDGKADIVVGSSGGINILLNTGTGTFAAASTTYDSKGSSVQRVKLGDVNNDGKLDVVTANTFENNVSVLLGTGTGALGTAATYSAGSNSGLTSVALSDLNKDGRLDLVSANYSINSAGVLLGQSAGGFPATATLFSTGSNGAPNDVVIADVNNDTKPDIIIANSTTSRVAVLLNTSVLAARSALTATNVVLYPNPAHGSFAVRVPAIAGATTVVAELRTVLGQQVQQQAAQLPPTGATLTLPTAGLAAGVYVLHLQAGDNSLSQRVVVE